jgi:hypothetical protein
MEACAAIWSKVEYLKENPDELAGIRLPAVREVFQHVIQSMGDAHFYSKHSDHSKTSTKGCAIGCIGG